MAGAGEVGGRRGRQGERAGGEGAVVCGDSGGGAYGEGESDAWRTVRRVGRTVLVVDGHGVGSAVSLFILGDHHWYLEFL